MNMDSLVTDLTESDEDQLSEVGDFVPDQLKKP
jgi:hypothetical protein